MEKKKELLDKKLQLCADRLIDNIKFAPCNQNDIKGKISFVFECNGDEIGYYLRNRSG